MNQLDTNAQVELAVKQPFVCADHQIAQGGEHIRVQSEFRFFEDNDRRTVGIEEYSIFLPRSVQSGRSMLRVVGS